MFAIVGILLVFGAVIGGFLMEKGHLAVLLQPAEFLIIAGSAAGTLLIANPMHVVKKILSGTFSIFGKAPFGKERYISTLRMMYELLNKARRGGMLSIEDDIEKPAESVLFHPYPQFLRDEHIRDFVCDTMRMAVTGGVEPFDVDQMMDLDMEVRHRETNQPVHALTAVAESLPGLGIIAAVLGVVITMGALGGPPDAIGHKVAAALVGTFLGILLCYGLVGPIGAYMGKAAEDEHAFLYVLRVLMASFIKGNPPVQAVEIARRAIPLHVRPSFEEVEAACRGEQSGARMQEEAA
ncbi:flagellar motor stator protein MotA [Silvibacterium acidisoli]|uniref:flagellar motor stator protein MotA n=1 Tax=Acidobacteriaceae bacterium ZG23-2 TaxID=2883246 RepID=UPI00406CC998